MWLNELFKHCPARWVAGAESSKPRRRAGIRMFFSGASKTQPDSPRPPNLILPNRAR